MQYAISREQVEPRRIAGDTLEVRALFEDANGCEKFAQRLLSFAPGRSQPRCAEADDEVLFVLSGGARLELDAESVTVARHSGVYLRRGCVWALDCDEPVELISVLVHAPEPSATRHAVVELGGEARHHATGARQFSLGVDPDAGCPSVTQFIGYVPPGRAPDHYHHYDELLWVLAGRGVLHIAGDAAPLAAGVCVHLPARLVHCLENTGASELELLGVFRPAGSPAEAYYPDGTPAPYPQES
jgi:mannose-6-phosphate isomerase-like protein (cupin superfamily)